MNRYITPFVYFLVLSGASATPATVNAGKDSITIGHFSVETPASPLPISWQPLEFQSIDQHTDYRLVQDNDTTVVQATSNASASGLIRRVNIDPKKYPVIRWRWKVANVLQKGDVTRKKGDDYPARLYITFAYDESKLSFFEKTKYEAYHLVVGDYPPLAALNYLYASNSKPGTMVTNAYTDRTMMFVLRSGTDKLNQWVSEERNIYEDYIAAFGEPPPPISGVAIMSDTDNTKEQSVAWYGDIVFARSRQDTD